MLVLRGVYVHAVCVRVSRVSVLWLPPPPPVRYNDFVRFLRYFLRDLITNDSLELLWASREEKSVLLFVGR
jgi:hypothetical protein